MNFIPKPLSVQPNQAEGTEVLSYSRWLSWWWSPALFLVIPTLWLIAYVNLGLGTVSEAIEHTWSTRLLFPVLQALQADFSVSPTTTNVIHVSLDIMRLMAIGLMGWLYIQGFQTFRTHPERLPGLSRLLLGVGILGGLLMWVVPFHSSDLYGYINRGAQQVFLHTNPYITPIGNIPDWQDQPYFHGHWLSNPCPYGFFFANVARWLVAISHGEFWRCVALFKFSHVVLHLLNTLLVYVMVRHWPSESSSNNPNNMSDSLIAKSRFSAWLVGFNPLLLLHSIANGHNDLWVSAGLLGCMVCLTLAYHHAHHRWLTFLAFPLLWCAVLTKYAPLVALPFMALFWWHTQRHHPRHASSRFTLVTDGLSMLGLCLLVTIFLAKPYATDWAHFPWKVMAGNAGMVQHSLHSMLSRMVFYLEHVLPALQGSYPLVRQSVSPIVWSGFVLVYAVIGIHQACQTLWPTPWRKQENVNPHQRQQSLLFWAISLLALMLVVVSSKYHPWYLGMVLPAAFCLPPPQHHGHRWVIPVQGALLALSVWQLLAFTPLHNVHVLNYAILSILPIVWGTRWALRHQAFGIIINKPPIN